MLLWEEHGGAAAVLIPALNPVRALSLWSVLTICPKPPPPPPQVGDEDQMEKCILGKKGRRKQNSHMMAMRELKLPMLKHSRATSMKNSMTRALCFFFTGCRRT